MRGVRCGWPASLATECAVAAGAAVVARLVPADLIDFMKEPSVAKLVAAPLILLSLLKLMATLCHPKTAILEGAPRTRPLFGFRLPRPRNLLSCVVCAQRVFSPARHKQR
jgi:hypothetical protein